MKEKDQYSILDEANIVAGNAWENHGITQAEKVVGELQVHALADELVGMLINCPISNMQVLKNVFLERQVYPDRSVALPRVAMTVCREAVGSLLGIRGVDYISFQTCPQWTLVEGAEKMRFLVIGKSVYSWGECGLGKTDADLKLIADILESMQDRLGALIIL